MARNRRRGRLALIVLLGALEAVGPLSLDLYMPTLPALAQALGTDDHGAQITMSSCMLGLALGQLVMGPLSDRWGRRPPLLAGLALFTAFSVASAVSSSVEWLIAFRFLQGVGGSAGMVITLAIARDLFSGARLSRMLSWLVLIGAVAPIVAPVIGGQLAAVMDWRGIFLILAGTGAVLLLVAGGLLQESHRPGPVARRGSRFLGDARALLGPGEFRVLLAIGAISGVAFFSYLSMSSFVLQRELGFGPQMFGVLFAAGSVCSAIGAQASRALVSRLGVRRLYLCGLALGLAASAVALAGALLGEAVLYLCGMGLYLLSTGIVLPNGNALALTGNGARAGTAAALMGSASLIIGPIVAPAVSVNGITATTLALTVCTTLAACTALGWWKLRTPG